MNPANDDRKVLECSLVECSDSEWYRSPEDHRCPHDAWVESIQIVEPSACDRREKRSINIHIRLLGAYQGGMIDLIYANVSSYSVEVNRSIWRGTAIGHGDWLEDHIEQSADGTLIIHEIKFESGTISASARDVRYRWSPLPM
jgi:hypothetical protein